MFTFMVHIPVIVSSDHILLCALQWKSVRSLIHHRSDALDGQAVANVEFFSGLFFSNFIFLSFFIVF